MPPVVLQFQAQGQGEVIQALTDMEARWAAWNAEDAKTASILDQNAAAVKQVDAALANLAARVFVAGDDSKKLQAAIDQSDLSFAKLAITTQGQASSALTNFGVAIQEAKDKLNTLPPVVDDASASWGRLLAQGAQLALGFSTVYGALQLLKSGIGDAISAAGEFQQSLVTIQNVSGASAQQLDAIRQQLLAINPALGSSTELAGAYANALRSTGDGAKALEDVTAAATLAKATGGELDMTTRGLTEAMGAFGKQAGDASHTADILYVGWKNATGTLAQFQQGLAQVAPVAAGLKISMQDTTATLAAMSDAMKSPQAAAFALQMILVALTRNHAELAAQGINVKQILAGGGGLMDIFKELAPLLAGNSDEAQKLGIQGRALGAVLELTGTAAERNTQIHRDMANATGQAAAAQQTATATYNESIKQLGAAWTNLTNTVLPPFIAELTRTVNEIQSHIQFINSWGTAHKQVVAPIDEAAAAAKREKEAVEGTTNTQRAYLSEAELVMELRRQHIPVTAELVQKMLDEARAAGVLTDAQRTSVAATNLQADATRAFDEALKEEEDGYRRSAEAAKEQQAADEQEARDASVMAVARVQSIEKVAQSEQQAAAADVQLAVLHLQLAQGKTDADIRAAQASLDAAKAAQLAAQGVKLAAEEEVLAAQRVETELSTKLTVQQKINAFRELDAKAIQIHAAEEVNAFRQGAEAALAAAQAKQKAAQDTLVLGQAEEKLAQAQVQGAQAALSTADSHVKAEEAKIAAAQRSGQAISDSNLKVAEAEKQSAEAAIYNRDQHVLSAKEIVLQEQAVLIAVNTRWSEERKAAELAVNYAEQVLVARQKVALQAKKDTADLIAGLQQQQEAEKKRIAALQVGFTDAQSGITKFADGLSIAISRVDTLTIHITGMAAQVGIFFANSGAAFQKMATDADGLRSQMASISAALATLTTDSIRYRTEGATLWYDEIKLAQQYNTILGQLSDSLLRLEAQGKEMTDHLQTAYDILNAHSSNALKQMADAAVKAFEIARLSGTSTAEHLADIWVKDVIPKILEAYGTIPPAFAALNAAMQQNVQQTATTTVQAVTTAVQQTTTLVTAAAQAAQAAVSQTVALGMEAVGQLTQMLNGANISFAPPGTGQPGFQPSGTPPGVGSPYVPPPTGVTRSYQSGTPYVPYDMLAYLHQGERVVPAAQNMPAARPGQDIAGSASVVHNNVSVTVQVTLPPGMDRITAQNLVTQITPALNEAIRRNQIQTS